ncbi:MAG: beta-propeller fold lactonase family protein, partial [Pirellulaceae bacterium]
MSHPIARTRLLATGCLILGALTAATEAHDMIVFVAAFAPGEEGAIYAYQLETTTGQLKLLRRTAGVEHPFFLALSPNKKFLYSIH